MLRHKRRLCRQHWKTAPYLPAFVPNRNGIAQINDLGAEQRDMVSIHNLCLRLYPPAIYKSTIAAFVGNSAASPIDCQDCMVSRDQGDSFNNDVISFFCPNSDRGDIADIIFLRLIDINSQFSYDDSNTC